MAKASDGGFDFTSFDPDNLPDKAFRVPDLAQAVEGWRAWGVQKHLPRYELAPKLWSVTYGGYYWTPHRAMEATCDRRGKGGGCGDNGVGVPGEHCSCGFYTARTYEHLMSMSYHLYDAEASDMFHVVGQVANWGKVIVGTQGWRSQYAYPVRLFVPFEAWHLAEPLGQAYFGPNWKRDGRIQLKNILSRKTAA